MVLPEHGREMPAVAGALAGFTSAESHQVPPAQPAKPGFLTSTQAYGGVGKMEALGTKEPPPLELDKQSQEYSVR